MHRVEKIAIIVDVYLLSKMPYLDSIVIGLCCGLQSE